MAIRLISSDPRFDLEFSTFLTTKRENAADVSASTSQIISLVRSGGDEALIKLTGLYDRNQLNVDDLRIDVQRIIEARAHCNPATISALEFAHERIRTYHEYHRPTDHSYIDKAGVKLGHRWTAVSSAGLYVPGGTAAYPSSVLMNAVPAKIAGVNRIAITVPAPDGVLNPLVLAAASIAGIDEIYQIGGAQAIAALAYGTPTIAPVNVIVGPGNAYVAAAKRHVFGQVGIDMIAGPSEVLILADGNANPEWIAADLLAQAEHDEAAQSILITDNMEFGDSVEQAVQRQLTTLKRAKIASASWRDFGCIIVVDDWDRAVQLADHIAPEHLQIVTNDADSISQRIHHAGAIFIGAHTPEVIGDYVAGTNHVLPTSRSARYASGLGVLDFMKRTSIIKCSADAFHSLAPAAITLGHAEGLEAHARAVEIRLKSRFSK